MICAEGFDEIGERSVPAAAAAKTAALTGGYVDGEGVAVSPVSAAADGTVARLDLSAPFIDAVGLQILIGKAEDAVLKRFGWHEMAAPF